MKVVGASSVGLHPPCGQMPISNLRSAANQQHDLPQGSELAYSQRFSQENVDGDTAVLWYSTWHNFKKHLAQPTPGLGQGITTEEPKDHKSPGDWHGVKCSSDTWGGPHGGLGTRGWGPPGEQGSRDAQGVQARGARGQSCLLSPPLRPRQRGWFCCGRSGREGTAQIKGLFIHSSDN